MASFWSRVASVGLSLAGLVAGDMKTFDNPSEFNKLAAHGERPGFATQRYRSSGIVGPVFNLNVLDSDRVDDAPYLFLGTVYGHMHAGPMIVDSSDLSLIYADQRYENSYHSDVQMRNGEPLLVFWEGYHARGHANGWTLVYDQHYNLKYNMSGVNLNGAQADMHEAAFSPDGNMIFSVYVNRPWDCTAFGGPRECLLMDSGFQEIDPETGKLVFEWYASQTLKPIDSFGKYTKAYGVGPNTGFDHAHINSIKKTEDGNYLISSRHHSSVVMLNGTDSSTIWILGGKNNMFEDLSEGRATNNGWQHDVRFINGDQTQISMFDNHGEHSGPCDPQKGCGTRALHLEVDPVKMTARVVAEYYNPHKLDVGAMGGVQVLNNGNFLVGWGYKPGWVEYAPDGTVVWDAQRGSIDEKFLDGMFAYRVSKHSWKGTPNWPPSIAVDSPQKSAEDATIYVSWNGATEVKKWVIFASESSLEIADVANIVAESPRTGFETTLLLGGVSRAQYVAAAAVDTEGNVLGSTNIIDMKTGKPFLMNSQVETIEPPQPVDDYPPPPPTEVPPPAVGALPPADEALPPPADDTGIIIAPGDQAETVPADDSKQPADAPPGEQAEASSVLSTGLLGWLSVAIFCGGVFYLGLYIGRRKVLADSRGTYSKVAEA